MSAWETLGTQGDEPAHIKKFGELWRASDKVVYSTTLGPVCAARTRIEHAFEPDAVRRMKDELAGDISIGGPTLAAQAIAAGLVAASGRRERYPDESAGAPLVRNTLI